MHNPKNESGEPWPQDVYYMDEPSAKKFLDDNISKILSVEELN